MPACKVTALITCIDMLMVARELIGRHQWAAYSVGTLAHNYPMRQDPGIHSTDEVCAHVEVDGARMMAPKTGDYPGMTRTVVALPASAWADVRPPSGLSTST